MKILFVCTHNRCRSILAEAVTNHLSDGSIQARSAGSQPVGEVHPLSLKYLAQADIPTDGLQSQSWDEFESWAPDLVVTVCDSAAGETCPVWFGNALRSHWGLVDPSRVDGTEAEIADAFGNCIQTITHRISSLMKNDLESMSASELLSSLNQLSESYP